MSHVNKADGDVCTFTCTGRNDLTTTGLQAEIKSGENWSSASNKNVFKKHHISTYVCLIDINKLFTPQNTPFNIYQLPSQKNYPSDYKYRGKVISNPIFMNQDFF